MSEWITNCEVEGALIVPKGLGQQPFCRCRVVGLDAIIYTQNDEVGHQTQTQSPRHGNLLVEVLADGAVGLIQIILQRPDIAGIPEGGELELPEQTTSQLDGGIQSDIATLVEKVVLART